MNYSGRSRGRPRKDTAMVPLEVRTCSDRATAHRAHVWHIDLMSTDYYYCPGIDVAIGVDRESHRP